MKSCMRQVSLIDFITKEKTSIYRELYIKNVPLRIEDTRHRLQQKKESLQPLSNDERPNLG